MAIQRRYLIGPAMAQGGFGTVYAATQVNLDGFERPVAIKVLRDTDEAAHEYAQRLRDEARMLGMIRNRAIVEVHGLIQLRGRWAVAMEWVDGVDLAQLIALGPLPASVALAITAEVAAALHVAYTTAGPGGKPLRLLHRDIKPGNIRVSADGDVKILDFGAGRAEFSEREAKTEAFTFGSMSYMAPERLDGFDSHAADVYSVGVVLFEMLTASAYGRSSAAPERHAQRKREVMDHLWRATEGQSEDLVRLAGGLLAYEPTDRPDARAVERFCSSLGRTFEGPLLRDWAESAVAAALPLVPPPTDGELTGLEFTDTGLEIPAALQDIAPGAAPVPLDRRSDGHARADFGAGAVTLPPPELSQLFEPSVGRPVAPGGPAAPPPPSPRTLPKPPMVSEPEPGVFPARLVVGGAVAAVLIGAGLALVSHFLGPREAPTVQTAPPSTLSAPTVPLSLEIDGQAAPIGEPEPERPRSSGKRSPAASATPATTGRVEITGYAQEVWLVSEAGRKPPGELPVGRYRVQARFDADDTLKTVGTVDVMPGTTHRLNCSKVYGNCSTRD